MAGRLVCGLFALAAYATAASISGSAGIDPSQAYIGGRVTFPQIPGINAPLFGWLGSTPGFGGGFPGLIGFPDLGNIPGIGGLSSFAAGLPGISDIPGFGSDGKDNNAIDSSRSSNTDGSSSNGIFGPFAPFLRHIPILNLFLGSNNSPLPSDFANLDDALAKLPNNTGNYSLPSFSLPDSNQGPYISGLSEALDGARNNLKLALNISADLSAGLRDAVATALDSDHPADSIRIILNTIAGVYSTVAANCPFFVVGARVFHEGIRLAGEVARSVVNVAVGSENNPF